MPLISVIIPAYNAASYIGEALASVATQRGAPAIEVVVVDDGSTDDTRTIVEDFAATHGSTLRMCLISQPNAGLSAARNRGIEAASGDLIALLDADDLWPSDRLCIQLALLAQHPQAGLIFGDCRCFDTSGPRPRTQFEEEGRTTSYWGEPVLVRDPYAKLITENFVPVSTVLARRADILVAGGFDEDRCLVEDLDLWLRMAMCCQFAYTTDLCALKRIHGSSLSANADAMALAYIEVLENQVRRFPSELSRRGIRVAPLIGREYALIGDRRERRGDRAGARHAYLAALHAYPSVRPVYYWTRTWLPARPPAL
jgi:GT2 family glycosyltransferase